MVCSSSVRRSRSVDAIHPDTEPYPLSYLHVAPDTVAAAVDDTGPEPWAQDPAVHPTSRHHATVIQTLYSAPTSRGAPCGFPPGEPPVASRLPPPVPVSSPAALRSPEDACASPGTILDSHRHCHSTKAAPASSILRRNEAGSWPTSNTT